MIPLLIAVPFGPLLAWKRGNLYGAFERLYVAAGIGLLMALVVIYVSTGAPVMAALGIALGVYLVIGALTDPFLRAGFARLPLRTALGRLAGLPRSAFGTALAHLGLGVSVIGIVAVTAFETETVVNLEPGQTVELSGHTLQFQGLRAVAGPNYNDEVGSFIVLKEGVEVARVSSAKRFYPARQMPTTEAGIVTFGVSQLYVSLGDTVANGGTVVRVWWKPWVIFIWLGTIFMMAGGLVSLSDRRLRIGAPSSRKLAGKAIGQTPGKAGMPVPSKPLGAAE